MQKTYSASKVEVDSCNTITWETEWVWVAIGLVVGVLLMAVVIVFVKKQRGTKRKVEMDDASPSMKMPRQKRVSMPRRTRHFDIINKNHKD